ncbi:frizzled-4-like [Oratosquilla oratoria]|uniref:frizzled-4-like n=1 Tax=Oratosquilla oratoria TaxID=337810 RepID=UPI003F76F5F5
MGTNTQLPPKWQVVIWLWACCGLAWAAAAAAAGDYPAVAVDPHPPPPPPGPRTCEVIKIEECAGVGYNHTSMPNLVGMDLQSDARDQLESFKPLIQYSCSSQLRVFLCGMYAPMCTPEVPTPIGPCRNLCETVRDRCIPVLRDFGYNWPPLFNCSLLPPENNDKHMCMEGPGEAMPPPTTTYSQRRPSDARPHPMEKCGHLAHPLQYHYLNATGVCAPRCDANISFSSEDKTFAEVWLAIWSVCCFGATLFTVLTFVLDASSFKFPERPAIFVTLCYNVVSVGYLVRLAAGRHEITCQLDRESGVEVRVTEGSLHTNCALVFLLLYYFSTAASVWWVMLCASWLLRAWRGLSHEQILRQSSWFHVAAWGLPAAQTIVCLVMRKVDADELTGTCYAGQQNTETLVKFVLAPQFLYLVSGATLVLLVFACLWRTWRRLKTQGQKTDRIDVAAARVGIMSVLYMVPATCQVGATFYEFAERDHWLRNPSVTPNMAVFMLKLFMSLAVGIMAGLVLVNGRVLHSWRQLCHRFASRKKPLPPYLMAPHLQHPQIVSEKTPHHHHHHHHHHQYHTAATSTSTSSAPLKPQLHLYHPPQQQTHHAYPYAAIHSHRPHSHRPHSKHHRKCGSETQV